MDSNFIFLISGQFTHKFIERTLLTKMKDCKHIYIEENKLIAYNENETSGYLSITTKDYDTRYIVYTGVKDVEKFRTDVSNVSSIDDLDDSYKNSPISLIEYNDKDRKWNHFVRGYNNNSPSGYFLGKWSTKGDDIPSWFCFTTSLDVLPVKKGKISIINNTATGGRESWRDDDYKFYTWDEW
jgi:hypothetical protein